MQSATIDCSFQCSAGFQPLLEAGRFQLEGLAVKAVMGFLANPG
jgi:hypothetical protein